MILKQSCSYYLGHLNNCTMITEATENSKKSNSESNTIFTYNPQKDSNEVNMLQNQ